MKVDAISNVFNEVLQNQTEKVNDNKFSNVFTDLIKSVNQDQMDSDSITKDFVLGENVEIHQVMIAAEKAKTSLELLMEIRNKAVDTYKELTRIQL
jgi:flagellar hook-basal body complex protein FliE